MGRHLLEPNVHVILIHYPLGVFMLGVFLEVFSFLWKRSSVRVAARWMIFLGALSTLPAITSGLDALWDVSSNQRGGITPDQRTGLSKHILLTTTGAGLAVICVIAWMGASDLWRRRLYYPLLVLMIGAVGLIVFGSHMGGQGVYLNSLAVKLKGKPATGAEYFAPARETHAIMAGLAFAVALGALAASLRRLTTLAAVQREVDDEEELAALEGVRPPRPRPADDMTVARTMNPAAEIAPPTIPSARFWLLTCVLMLVTFLAGIWFLMQESDFLSNNKVTAGNVKTLLVDAATGTKEVGQNRKGAHIVMGIALLVLPLILAAAVRWGTRRRWVVAGLCLVMVLVVAAEFWLGILLMNDDSKGPLYKFVPASDATVADTR